jgi:UDP-N-acetylmuramate--alanine ligase
MSNYVDLSGRPFHFIGIGGIGMSALAYLLAKQGLPVSGSDLRLTHITQRLQEQGIHIFWSQEGNNLSFFHDTYSSSVDLKSETVSRHCIQSSPSTTSIDGNWLPQVICSTAINPHNSEYQAALNLGCSIFHRSDLLAAFIENHHSIAVAGTHGKTTTSSLIGHLLVETGLDPSIVVGGEVNSWGGNARAGNSQYLVAEADESDGSLVKFNPAVGVVTNIELDHIDHYSNLEQVIATFQTFANNCDRVIACLDCPNIRVHLPFTLSYSLVDLSADYCVDQVSYGAESTQATVIERGEVLGRLSLKILGKHNLSNTLAAVAVGRSLGLNFNEISTALETFQGARRRFEYRGYSQGIWFVDDYAHHPSELRATLSSARLQVNERSPNSPRRVVAIFQPHRYSRTFAFLEDFANAFENADIVVLTDIYSAGEPNEAKITGQQLADMMATRHPHVVYCPTLPSVTNYLRNSLIPKDLALFLGAGNLNQVIPELLSIYQQQEILRVLPTSA